MLRARDCLSLWSGLVRGGRLGGYTGRYVRSWRGLRRRRLIGFFCFVRRSMGRAISRRRGFLRICWGLILRWTLFLRVRRVIWRWSLVVRYGIVCVVLSMGGCSILG